MLIVNLNESPSLLRNDLSGEQNWIKVKLQGMKSNRSAIETRVLAPLRRENAGAEPLQSIQLLFLQRWAPAFRPRKQYFGELWKCIARADLRRALKTDRAARGCSVVPNRGWAKT
jgi:hypothetical protein